MMRARAFAWLLVVVARAADNQPSAPSNITGRVLNGVTGEPLKKSELALRNQTASGTGYHATTDETGSFSFRTANGGKYELMVQRDGFVQTKISLAIVSGQNQAGISIRLMPQGVVAGEVMDAEGDPVPGATVHLIQLRRVGGA